MNVLDNSQPQRPLCFLEVRYILPHELELGGPAPALAPTLAPVATPPPTADTSSATASFFGAKMNMAARKPPPPPPHQPGIGTAPDAPCTRKSTSTTSAGCTDGVSTCWTPKKSHTPAGMERVNPKINSGFCAKKMSMGQVLRWERMRRQWSLQQCVMRMVANQPRLAHTLTADVLLRIEHQQQLPGDLMWQTAKQMFGLSRAVEQSLGQDMSFSPLQHHHHHHHHQRVI